MAHVALFGNVGILRADCPKCGDIVLVVDGRTVCCDEAVTVVPDKYKRETEPDWSRNRPKLSEQEEILELQEHRCMYCEQTFGTHVIVKRKLVRLIVTWDHFVPYSFSANNYAYNFVAACQVCNRIKSSLMFQTVEEARIYVQTRREEKGIIA